MRLTGRTGISTGPRRLWCSTPFEEVTDLQRRNAKAVNFGIVYGISSFGLSQDLSITRKEAQKYIDDYFAAYPKMKEFLDGLVRQGKETGEVKTMFGRIRPIPSCPQQLHAAPVRRAGGYELPDPGYRGRHHQDRHGAGARPAGAGRSPPG